MTGRGDRPTICQALIETVTGGPFLQWSFKGRKRSGIGFATGPRARKLTRVEIREDGRCRLVRGVHPAGRDRPSPRCGPPWSGTTNDPKRKKAHPRKFWKRMVPTPCVCRVVFESPWFKISETKPCFPVGKVGGGWAGQGQGGRRDTVPTHALRACASLQIWGSSGVRRSARPRLPEIPGNRVNGGRPDEVQGGGFPVKSTGRTVAGKSGMHGSAVTGWRARIRIMGGKASPV